MEDLHENDSRPITLLDIKENLKNYSLNKMKALSFILIDSLNKIGEDKTNLKKALEKCEEEVIDLSVQVIELTSEKGKIKDDLITYKEELVELSM